MGIDWAALFPRNNNNTNGSGHNGNGNGNVETEETRMMSTTTTTRVSTVIREDITERGFKQIQLQQVIG